MTKREIAIAVSAKSGIAQKTILKCLDPIFMSILEALESGKKVTFYNFGCFYVHEHKERKARNPSTGESIICPAKKIVKFKISPQNPYFIKDKSRTLH